MAKKRRSVKSEKSVSKKSVNILNSRKKKMCGAILNNTIVKEKYPLRSKRIINKLIKDNLLPINDKLKSMNTVSSKVTIPNIEKDNIINISNTSSNCNAYEDSQSSKVTCQNINNDSIIDITDTISNSNAMEDYQSVSSKVTCPNIENDVIVIDITDTSDNHKYNGWKPSTITMSSNDDDDEDIQIVGIHYINKPIDYITILDDSDEENIPCQQSIKKPVSLTPIRNELGNSNSKSYISPLNKYKKKVKDGNMSKQECLPKNLGPFVIDKQGISKYSKHIHTFDHKGAKFPSASVRTPDTTSDTTSDTTLKTTPKVNKQLRPIIIDGLNIGHAHGCGKFSVKGIELCIQYFSDRGHKDIVAFLPQHWQNPFTTESNAILNKLVQNGNICFTPSRKVKNIRMTCYDDRIILNYAHKCKGVVVSNDNYRDLYEESEAFKDIIENRQVMVTFIRNTIIVPDDQYNRKCAIRSLSDILCFPD